MPSDRDDGLRATLAAVAPGTPLRDALARILRGDTGGLIVLGYDRSVEALCTGGFPLDIELSAPLLRELVAMPSLGNCSTKNTSCQRRDTACATAQPTTPPPMIRILARSIPMKG